MSMCGQIIDVIYFLSLYVELLGKPDVHISHVYEQAKILTLWNQVEVD